MAFFFGEKKKKFLSLDIGTEAVKGAVFSIENKKVVIQKMAVSYFDKYGAFEGIDFKIEVFRKALSAVAVELYGNKGVIDVALLSLPEDNIHERISQHHFIRPDTKNKISEKEQKELYAEAIKQAKAQAIESLGLQEAELEFMDQSVIEGKINGYEVKHIAGYQGETIDLSVYLAFAKRDYIAFFKEYFANFNWKKKIFVSTNSALLSIFAFEKSNVLFLDVGGEETKILGIVSGVPSFAFEAPIGCWSMTKKISESMAITENSARELKHRYLDKALSQAVTGDIQKVAGIAAQEWFAEVKKNISSIKFQPNKVYVIGGGVNDDYISQIKMNWKGAEIAKISKNNIADLPKVDFSGFSEQQMMPMIINSLYAVKWNL